MSPFAELDALYRHIFSQIEDITPVLGLLAYAILGSVSNMKRAFYFFGIAEDDAESIFAQLTSVLSYDAETGRISFHHTSLPDFLKEEGRSQGYCISQLGTDLAIGWFRNAISGRFRDLSQGKQLLHNNSLIIHSSPIFVDEQNIDLIRFLDCSRGRLDLHASILEYRPDQTPWACDSDFFPRIILGRIREMVRIIF